ncbi:scavenger receptor class B member 1-like isoform X2 [Varroa jacobsoni]|uniref:scavenger receptor class B member 1-like isoform X2 n=1 Tax=Varroa jacobsoni TaxID=62625 RepID=UPI000BF6E8D4|nr:scavenger receptor class B member 1-like isoform X2 [Varroa jacobsoni]
MCGGSFCQSELNKPGGHRSEASVGRCTPHLAVTCSLCIGLFFCVFGMVSYAAFGPILRQQVKANLIIDPSNEVYENWKETPVPIYVSMFLFNYTNPDDIILGAKPKLQQLGPFVYRERRQKVNITFNGNGTVSYRQLLSYEHLPELSASSLDVKLYTLNVPMIGAAYKNRKTPSNEEQPMASALEEMFSKMNQSLLIHRTVRELLFDGYEDQMLKLAKQWSWSPITRFGYQIDRNNSNDGIYTVFTGENGMANYGTIESWQGRHRVIGFRKSCSFINGTTGEMWPPYTLTSKSSLLFFTSPLCRSLRLDFLRNEVVKGIQVLRYHLNERLFDYSIEENQCFCSKKKGKDPECFPNGVLDLNAPIVVSLPHLLYASPSITEAVEGLSPDPQLHEFFMDVEPSMGIPLRVSAKVQMNVIVDAFKYFKYFEMFETRKFLPTFWIETAAVVNDDFAFKIRLVVQDLGSYVSFASYAWVLIGLFIIMFTLGYVIAHTRRSRMGQPSPYGYSTIKMAEVVTGR